MQKIAPNTPGAALSTLLIQVLLTHLENIKDYLALFQTNVWKLRNILSWRVLFPKLTSSNERLSRLWPLMAPVIQAINKNPWDLGVMFFLPRQ